MADLRPGELVLEPSAGIGLLADGILSSIDVQFHCVELNQRCREVLSQKKYHLVGSDFFHFKTSVKYDAVVGAPNFKDNIDCDHVIKMHEHVKNGGRVVSIMSPFWMTGSSERQKRFREWLKDKTYRIEILPDFSYIEEGNTVPTIMIRIEK